MTVRLSTVLDAAEFGLANLGFHRLGRGMFLKPLDDHFAGWLGLNCAHRGELLEINPVIGVRNHEVEQLIERLAGVPLGKGKAPTISTSLGYVTPQAKYTAWFFRDPHDVEAGIADLLDAVRLFGLRFIADYSALESLAEGLENPRLSDVDSRRFRLPVVRLLLHDVEGALSLTRHYLEELQSRSDDLANNYRRFAASLLDGDATRT